MRVKSLYHVGVRMRDMLVASEFYVGVLDFRSNPAKTN